MRQPQKEVFELWLAHEAGKQPNAKTLLAATCICHLPCGDVLPADPEQFRNADGSIRGIGQFILAKAAEGICEHVGCSSNPVAQFRAL